MDMPEIRETFGKAACLSYFSGLRFPKDMTESEPQNRRLGYARISTYWQTLDAQIAQLRAEGCAKIYQEKASGAQTCRASGECRPIWLYIAGRLHAPNLSSPALPKEALNNSAPSIPGHVKSMT
jgi:hypothetical protein